MTAIRVAIVDDHESVRLGLRTEFERHSDIDLVGEAVDVQSALDLVRSTTPDILLLDMQIPGERDGEDGITVLSTLRKSQSPMKVVVHSMWDTEAYILSALAEDVSGYILKDERLHTVVEAIRFVGKPGNNEWFSQKVISRIVRSKQAGLNLTPRERQVLPLLSKTNEGIAKTLGITPHTVKKHVGQILAKLGVTSRTAALEKALKQGIITKHRR